MQSIKMVNANYKELGGSPELQTSFSVGFGGALNSLNYFIQSYFYVEINI